VTAPGVVLVGVPGAGKTTVGQALAERLGVAFRDTDADVEAADGRTIADIFVESGEPEFRRMESAAVVRALAEHPGVLALGGGAVTDPRTRGLLANHRVVWLRVGLAAASQRAGLGVARPVLLGNVRAQMKALMDARAPLYAEVATLVIDTDALAPEQAVESIISGLGLAPPLRERGHADHDRGGGTVGAADMGAAGDGADEGATDDGADVAADVAADPGADPGADAGADPGADAGADPGADVARGDAERDSWDRPEGAPR
jgi:shikimate kinase